MFFLFLVFVSAESGLETLQSRANLTNPDFRKIDHIVSGYKTGLQGSVWDNNHCVVKQILRRFRKWQREPPIPRILSCFKGVAPLGVFFRDLLVTKRVYNGPFEATTTALGSKFRVDSENGNESFWNQTFCTVLNGFTPWDPFSWLVFEHNTGLQGSVWDNYHCVVEQISSAISRTQTPFLQNLK